LSDFDQVKEGVAGVADPENTSLQDIFKTMATKVHTMMATFLPSIVSLPPQALQHWKDEADPAFDKDIERAQTLFLTAPTLKYTALHCTALHCTDRSEQAPGGQAEGGRSADQELGRGAEECVESFSFHPECLSHQHPL
jgi:hypothetical protein